MGFGVKEKKRKKRDHPERAAPDRNEEKLQLNARKAVSQT